MCFSGIPALKPYRYVSSYTSSVPQKQYRTLPSLEGNFHFWNVDNEGNIIDITPDGDGERNPARIRDDPIYIPWSLKEQKEQKDKLASIQSLDDWKPMLASLNYCYKNPAEGNCFLNSLAVQLQEGPRQVCGSMGYVIGEEKDFFVVALDYGF
tara:strand:- start:3545 stop:4003 length:459 start_codon:yes stop_codon:yes gene_type:complete